MSPRILLIPALAATMATLPTQAQAASNCRSVWNKATGKIQRFSEPLSKLVCKGMSIATSTDAKMCLAQVQKYAKQADEMVKAWNEDGDSWNIGPRPLPHDRYQTGAVSTERQFVGQPVLGDSYTLTLERTGGKAEKNLVVKVCMVDSNGTDVKYQTFKLSKNGAKKKTLTFHGVAGTFPLVHLNNERWGTNAHKYTIKGKPSGEAPNVKRARDLSGSSRTVSKKRRR